MTTYAAALQRGRATLSGAGVENAALDARLLLADAARVDMAALIARSSDPLPPLAGQAFRDHQHRRAAGEPVARILGHREFWGLPFEVNAATLVPRPDTETLVEVVLAELRGRHDARITICDLGTGSGAIPIALLCELPEPQAVAVDISEAALAVARRNAAKLGVAGRICFRPGNFAEEPQGRFDVVVSNPPYVPSNVIASLERDVRDFEPLIALDGGADGLEAYRTILARMPGMLALGGLVALEVGYDQGEAVARLCRERMFNEVAIICDLAGIGRVVVARATDRQTA